MRLMVGSCDFLYTQFFGIGNLLVSLHIIIQLMFLLLQVKRMGTLGLLF